MREQKLRNRMYAQIRTINKYLTDSYLNTLTTEQVIGLIHPLERERYQTEYELLKNKHNE